MTPEPCCLLSDAGKEELDLAARLARPNFHARAVFDGPPVSPDLTAAKIQVVLADMSRRELGRASAVAALALLIALASLIVALVK